MPATNHARTQARALLWEEVRTGGVIAAACTLLGVILLVWSRYLTGPDAWVRDDQLVKFAALWIPGGTALLLILNSDYAGHLTGGFSKRILRFPVSTRLAVAVSLVSRTFLVLCTSTILLWLTAILFEDAPRLSVVLVVAIAYLGAQTLDWMRGPISGLSSLIAIGLALFIVLWLVYGAPMADTTDLAAGSRQLPRSLPVVAIVIGAFAYLASILTVRADRVGRHYGIPEIWEWPRRLSVPTLSLRSRFASPAGAQVWFELRRSRFLLPITFTCTVGIAGIAAWILTRDAAEVWERARSRSIAMTLGPAAGILLGALAHGIHTRVLGFRGVNGRPGYEYLQPMTDAQFATARTIASAILLAPVLAVATLLHFGIGGGLVVIDAVLDAHRMGFSSLREVFWIFLSRGILIGGLAWALMAVGTRYVQMAMAATFAVFVVAGVVEVSSGVKLLSDQAYAFTTVVSAGFILAVALLLVHAVYVGQLSKRHAGFWLGVWAVTAWVLHYPIITRWVLVPVPFADRVGVIVTALGAASIVPLVYLAILRDVYRRRHPAAPHQEPNPNNPAMRPRTAIAFAAVACALLWFGWPATPSYVEFRQARGLPASLQELNDWYADPPESENQAATLMALARERNGLEHQYRRWFQLNETDLIGPKSHEGDSFTTSYDFFLYIVGGESVPRAQPLARVQWNVTASYWERVTATIAPKLRDVTSADLTESRYPVDLTEGYHVFLEHLDPQRILGRELALDALYWIVDGQPDRAIDDVAAGFALPDSLENEPLMISQFVRLSMLEQAIQSAVLVLVRSNPSEIQLDRLQRIVEDVDREALADSMRRALVGESTMALDVVNQYNVGSDSLEDATTGTLGLAYRLAFPADAQRAVLSMQMTPATETDRFDSWAEVHRRNWRTSDDDTIAAYMFIAPTVAYLTPSLTGIWNVYFRTTTGLDLLSLAIAMERYRLATGDIPNSLDALVPRFIPEVPVDPFSPTDESVQLLVDEAGEYTLFSVGRDGIDHTAKPWDKRYNRDDIPLTVAPLAVRPDPQIAAE